VYIVLVKLFRGLQAVNCGRIFQLHVHTFNIGFVLAFLRTSLFELVKRPLSNLLLFLRTHKRCQPYFNG
jgi:hypothetical protein